MKEKILITGATGMTGSCLATMLLHQGCHVKATYRSKQSIKQFEQNQAYYPNLQAHPQSELEWVETDLLNIESVFDALEGVSKVYHLAAMVSFNPADRNTMLETNIKGTANLVNASIDRKVKCFVHVSSIASLGAAETGKMIDENCHWIPGKKQSGYSLSKFHSEMEVWRGIEEGLKAVIVNPSIILGAGNWDSGSPSFFSNIAKGLKFYPKGTTGFVHVSDVAKAMMLLADETNFEKANGKRYLLSAENISYKQLFEHIAHALQVKKPSVGTTPLMLALGWRLMWLYAKLTGTKPQITRESVAAANNTNFYDGTRIVKEFNFTYQSIEESITEIAGFYKPS